MHVQFQINLCLRSILTYLLVNISGELGDYDPRAMHEAYVSEFRFVPDQVCEVFSLPNAVLTL